MNYTTTELHWLVVVVALIYNSPLLLLFKQAGSGSGLRYDYGLASSPNSHRRMPLAGQRHHHGSSAYKLGSVIERKGHRLEDSFGEPLDRIKPLVLRPYLVPSEGSKRANRYKGSEQRAFWRMAEEALGGFRGECVRLPSF